MKTEEIRLTNVCICPICGMNTCDIEAKDASSESRMCSNCGYMTSAAFKIDSLNIDKYEKTTAKIIKDLRYEDKSLGQFWYPAAVQISGIGMVFPVGTKESWKWGFAKVVTIPVFERIKYPIPGKANNYYETKLDVEHLETFDMFKDAMKKLGETK